MDAESELAKRIAALEKKVSDLYGRLGQAEPDLDSLLSADADPRIVELIQQGNEIEAAKLYRELNDVGIAEAKDAIDRLAATYGPTG